MDPEPEEVDDGGDEDEAEGAGEEVLGDVFLCASRAVSTSRVG